MKLITILLFTLVSMTLLGQKTPLLKNHQEEGLIYNPAFAGSKGHLTLNMSQKFQQTATDGNIISQFFTLHAPIRYTKIALGMNIMHQRLNNMSEVKASVDYAYRIETGFYSNLSLGLSATFNCCANDFKSLKKLALSDDITNSNHGTLSGDAGVGIQYKSEYFSAGIAMPELLQSILSRNEGTMKTPIERDYYLTLGTKFSLNNSYAMNVNLLLKSTNYITNVDSRIGLEYDLNVRLMMHQALYVGLSCRSSNEYTFNDLGQMSLGMDLRYHFNNNTQLGISFETPFYSPNDLIQNSVELIAVYNLPYKKETLLTPRYFF